jgi:hypothetical protein
MLLVNALETVDREINVVDVWLRLSGGIPLYEYAFTGKILHFGSKVVFILVIY